jgi:hypothetical protein
MTARLMALLLLAAMVAVYAIVLSRGDLGGLW